MLRGCFPGDIVVESFGFSRQRSSSSQTGRAGFLHPLFAEAGPRSNWPIRLRKDRPILVSHGHIFSKVLLEQGRSRRRRLAKDIELAVAYQPVLRVRHDDLAL